MASKSPEGHQQTPDGTAYLIPECKNTSDNVTTSIQLQRAQASKHQCHSTWTQFNRY